MLIKIFTTITPERWDDTHRSGAIFDPPVIFDRLIQVKMAQEIPIRGGYPSGGTPLAPS